MKKINNSFINFNTVILAIKQYTSFLQYKNLHYSNTFSQVSLFFLIGSLFVVVYTGISHTGNQPQKLEQELTYQYNIIKNVWAEEINGTESNDVINGTINQDTIRGFGGNDTISGKEAGDDISGGSGDDTIYGNEGRDVLKGKSGNDHIEGGDGNDRIYGDRGNDMLVGGRGNDTLTGGLGKDIFICGDGGDTITDFNVTQQDTIPENDCENIKDSNAKVVASTLAVEQKEPSSNGGSGFFGLFK